MNWRYAAGTPYVPSPALVGDRLYFTAANDTLLTVLDAKTGKAVLDKERLPQAKSFYASPIAAAGRVYFVDRRGTTVVLKAGDALDVLAVNKLDDPIDASPVAVGKQLFLRSHGSSCTASRRSDCPRRLTRWSASASSASASWAGSTTSRRSGSKGAKVAAVCSRDPAKLAGDWRNIRGNFGPEPGQVDLTGVKTYAALDELLADPDIDLIDICTVTDQHAPIAHRGAEGRQARPRREGHRA